MAMSSELLSDEAPLVSNFSRGRSSVAQFFIDVEGLLTFSIISKLNHPNK